MLEGWSRHPGGKDMNLLQGSGDIEEGMDPGGFEIQQNLKRSLKVGFHFQALYLWKLDGFNQVLQLPETGNQVCKQAS